MTDSNGLFELLVSDELLKSGYLKVSGGQGGVDLQRWDSLLLPCPELEPKSKR
jgi:hypothetical protein